MFPTRPAFRWFAWAALLPSLTGCATHRSAPTGDAELTAATTAAQQAFAQDRIELAAELYARALTRARAMDDAPAIADAAYNLAACLTELGQHARALAQLDEAQAEAQRAGRPIVDVLLVKAALARLQKEPGVAAALAHQILNHMPPPSDLERAQAYLVEAEAACDAGDITIAKSALGNLEPASITSPVLRARVISAIARTHLLEKDWRGAAEEFDRAADAARAAHRYPMMSQDLADAAHAYEAMGSTGVAADRYYRAGRAAYGLGDATGALKLLSASQAAAKAAGAGALAARANSLSAEISGAGAEK